MPWLSMSAVMLALAVILGAFGAHGLKPRLDAYSMEVYEKAVFYHFAHALGMLAVSTLARTQALNLALAHRVNWLLVTGILIFSGSLYLLAVTGIRTLGAITPLGGVAFILAWLYLAWAAREPRNG